MSKPNKFELLRKGFVDEYINDPNDPREVWFDPANNRVIREVKMPIALRAIGLLKDSFAVERIEDTTVIQRKLLFPNNIGIWSSAQVLHQAGFILELYDLLKGLQVNLYDGHPYNVVYEGSEPRWVDLGSLRSFSEPKGSCVDQINEFVALAEFFRIGFCHKIRKICVDCSSEVQLTKPLWINDVELMLRTCFEGLAEKDPNLSYVEKFYRLRDGENRQREGTWIGYSESLYTSEKGKTPSVYEKIINRVIGENNIKTMIDIGCNNGKYSVIAARQGVQVLALDVEDALICELFEYVSEEKLTITPVVSDLSLYCQTCNLTHKQFRPKVDLILAYAILHHMFHQDYITHGSKYDFESFFEEIKIFEPKVLILGFVSYEDIAFVQAENRKDWYNLENLLRVAHQKGYSTDVIPTNNTARNIIVCRQLSLDV